VTCGTCSHWTPSAYNPEHGAGLCTLDVLIESTTWPYRGFPMVAYPRVERHCRYWSAA